MRIVSYRENGREFWGVVDRSGKSIIPSGRIFVEGPETLLAFIQENGTIDANVLDMEGSVPLDGVELLSPIPKPQRNIICIGKNYEEHVQEIKNLDDDTLKRVMENPVFFTKATNAANGPYSKVPMHEEVTDFVDYEAELALIIGKRCVNVSEDDALDVIFGYTCLNDITARDVQKNGTQWFRGKSLDGYCPMGPWIVTKDELGLAGNLGVRSFVNGEPRQNGNTSIMINPIPRLINVLTQGLTLEPGDIIATGTPSGVGAGFEPPKPLKKGDVVRVEVDGIGYIENEME